LKSGRSSSSSINYREYRRVFIGRCHELIKLGHGRLDPSRYKSADEWTITGDLNAAIEAVCDDPPASIKKWVQFYHPSEESPVNSPFRSGKRRQKVDIQIVSAFNRPRARFLCEAKRLCRVPVHPVSVYLGPEGLGCFISGAYAREQPDGGMLGYVQSDSEAHWLNEIKKREEKMKTLKSGPNPVSAIPGCVNSEHNRPSVGESINIFHTMLMFQ